MHTQIHTRTYKRYEYVGKKVRLTAFARWRSRIITAMSVINANNDRIDWPITAADYAQHCSWSADRLTDVTKCDAQPPRHQCVVVIHASVALKRN